MLPDRHPVPIKMLIWIFMEYGFDFAYLETVAAAMGWLQMRDAVDADIPLGDKTYKASLIKLGWIDVSQVEAPKDEE